MCASVENSYIISLPTAWELSQLINKQVEDGLELLRNDFWFRDNVKKVKSDSRSTYAKIFIVASSSG